jgi:hypothetical protein
MKQLIKDYEHRLKTAETMLEHKNYGSIEQAERIKTKASCYRTFLAELKKQCNIANVVNQRELLLAWEKHSYGSEWSMHEDQIVPSIDEYLSQ